MIGLGDLQENGRIVAHEILEIGEDSMATAEWLEANGIDPDAVCLMGEHFAEGDFGPIRSFTTGFLLGMVTGRMRK